MNLLGLASAMGVPGTAVSKLLAGDATLAVAGRLDTMTFSVQAFIEGEARHGIARALGMKSSAAQELRSGISRDVAIGILVGLCIARPKDADDGATERPADTAAAGDSVDVPQ